MRLHGSPEDRGAADRYYGRSRNPHYYPNGTHTVPLVTLLNKAEVAAYNRAYDEETDRKDWGEDI